MRTVRTQTPHQISPAHDSRQHPDRQFLRCHHGARQHQFFDFGTDFRNQGKLDALVQNDDIIIGQAEYLQIRRLVGGFCALFGLACVFTLVALFNIAELAMSAESLSQYSALMVMEREYGPERMRQFLRYGVTSIFVPGGTGANDADFTTLRDQSRTLWPDIGGVCGHIKTCSGDHTDTGSSRNR